MPGGRTAIPAAPSSGRAQDAEGCTARRTGAPEGRLRHRRGFLLGLTVALLALLSVLELRLFVTPATGSVQDPQAVIALGGYGDRASAAVELAHEQHITTVVFSTGAPDECPAHLQGLIVRCFVPQPVSTQGEARAIAELAHQYHWTRLLVVAGTTQISRADLRIGRCFGGQVAFAGVDPSGILQWGYRLVYDTAAMLKATVWQWGC
jgi:hypothetical protein